MSLPCRSLFVSGSFQRAQPRQLLFICLRKLIAEQVSEAAVLVPDPTTKPLAVEIPVLEPGRSAEERPFLQLPIEVCLFSTIVNDTWINALSSSRATSY